MSLLIDTLVYAALSGAGAFATHEIVQGSGAPPVMRDDGVVVLRPGRMVAVVGLMCIVMALFVIVMESVAPSQNEDRVVSFVMWAAFGNCGVYLITVARRKRVELGPVGVCERGTFGTLRHVRWKGVTEVKFSELGGNIL